MLYCSWIITPPSILYKKLKTKDISILLFLNEYYTDKRILLGFIHHQTQQQGNFETKDRKMQQSKMYTPFTYFYAILFLVKDSLKVYFWS